MLKAVIGPLVPRLLTASAPSPASPASAPPEGWVWFGGTPPAGDSHPIAVAKLTRFLVEHDVPFVLYEAFQINDRDEIVFESDFPTEEQSGP